MHKSLTASQEAKVAGEFEFKIVGKDGSVRMATAPSHNLILDQGLDLLISTSQVLSNLFAVCRVGTGTEQPQPGDLGLTDQIGQPSNNKVNYTAQWDQSPEPGIYNLRRSFRFDFSTAGSRGISGVQLSEVSVGTTNTAIAKSLIRDMQGNPTTIQLAEEEILQVTYRIFFYFDARSPKTGTFVLNEGLPDEAVYDYTWQYLSLGQPTSLSTLWSGLLHFNSIRVFGSQDLLPVTTSFPGGASTPAGSLTKSPYIPGSFTATYSARFLINQANPPEGIGRFTLDYFGGAAGNFSGIQIVVERQGDGGRIPKDMDHRLDLEDFFHFSLSRYELPEE